MPAIKINDKIICVISETNENEEFNPNEEKLDEKNILIIFGPISFYTTKETKPIGEPIIKTRKISLKFPVSLFRRQSDNENTLLRRTNLFFKGLNSILVPCDIPISSTIHKKNMSMSIGSKNITRKWGFIPTEKFWQDYEKEVSNIPIILGKDRFMIKSLMWLGHRLELGSNIQSFLDSYRILENLAARDFEEMSKDVNKYLNQNQKWNIFVKDIRPFNIKPEESNFVEAFSKRKWKLKKQHWKRIKDIRNAIVHGKSPDVEFMDYFKETYKILDDFARLILTNEIKPLIKTNILASYEDRYITVTPDGKLYFEPIYNCSVKIEDGTEYKIEYLSDKKFNKAISNLKPEEADKLKKYYEYRSNNIMVKDVPSTIIKRKKVIMNNLDYGGIMTIEEQNHQQKKVE